MLVQYTQVSSLPADQKARLGAYVTNWQQFEGMGHITFEGLTFNKSDVYMHFPRMTEARKPPGQQLNG